MDFGDIIVRFNILDAMKHPYEDHSVLRGEILDNVVDGHVSDFHSLHAMKYALLSKLSEFGCIDIDYDDYETDVDFEFHVE